MVFSYAGDGLPSVQEFTDVLAHTHKGKGDVGQVEELSVKDFDPRGEYKEIIRRVEQAGKGNPGVNIFRVEASSTRAEYYVLTVGERNLIGVVAKAVES